jgi:nitroreductase
VSQVQELGYFEVVRARRSVRRFEERAIDRATLVAVLECARSAPSAGNLQAYEIVVVEDEGRRGPLARAALDQPHVARAPTVLVFLADPARSARKYGQRGVELYALQDATIACSYAQLAASALGLGSCWTGAFYREQVSAAIGAPAGLVPVALLCLGHPAEQPSATERRPLSSLVRWDPLVKEPPPR